MNTTYNKTIDQAQEYISVNSENGMLSLPTRLNGFKQTHFKQQEFVRNEGTKANPFIRKRIEYSFLGSYEDPEGKESLGDRIVCDLKKYELLLLGELFGEPNYDNENTI